MLVKMYVLFYKPAYKGLTEVSVKVDNKIKLCILISEM
jgi:hypothetical protein